MNGVRQDLRFGLRQAARSPGFTALAVLTLAAGIGANTAIFGVVNAVLLAPLPYEDPDRLVMIWGQNLAKGSELDLVSAPEFAAWSSHGPLFDRIAASRDASYSLTGSGEPESIFGYRFSAGFFGVLGVDPLLGRTFLPEEDRPGGDRVVVLSHRLWQRRFGSDPGILGAPITLSDSAYTVIGVMPPGFQHPPGCELWTPLALDPEPAADRSRRFLRVMARLRRGVTIAAAQEGMDAIMAGIEAEWPDSNTGQRASVVSLRQERVGDVQPALLVLLGAVGFVLLIACANAAHLTLARATARRKEIAIRAALGAGLPRLFRQLLTESALLSAAAGALGLLIAFWLVALLVTIFPKNIANLRMPIVEEIPIDGRVLGFTLLIAALSGLATGLAPAWRAARTDPARALGAGTRDAASGAEGRRVRAALVVAETAIAVVLLAGAGLMARSFLRLQRSDLGIDPDQVLSAQVFLPRSRYADAGARSRFVESVVERLRVLPGVRSAGATNFLPLSGFWGTINFTVEGVAEPRPGLEPEADNRVASSDYFRTTGMRLIAGREFTDGDREGAPQVAIVNETMVRRYFQGGDPVGGRLNLGGREEPSWWEVVGVVADVKSFGPDQEAHAEIFRPFAQVPFPLVAFVVRTDSDPESLAAAARRAVWEVDKDQPVLKALGMRQLAAESVAPRRISTLLMGAFALMAIALAAVGIYGVMTYAVSLRTHEIGVRMALGARSADILRLVIREGMGLTLSGLALGLLAALGLTRFLESMLFGVDPGDPATLACVTTLLAAVSFAAACVPARRAARVDPMVALRQE